MSFVLFLRSRRPLKAPAFHWHQNMRLVFGVRLYLILYGNVDMLNGSDELYDNIDILNGPDEFEVGSKL